MIEGRELDEIVFRMGVDDEIIGGLQLNGGPKVAEAERDGTTIVNVAWVPQKANTGECLVLYRRGLLSHCRSL